jgi:hypothetical protein
VKAAALSVAAAVASLLLLWRGEASLSMFGVMSVFVFVTTITQIHPTNVSNLSNAYVLLPVCCVAMASLAAYNTCSALQLPEHHTRRVHTKAPNALAITHDAILGTGAHYSDCLRSATVTLAFS